MHVRALALIQDRRTRNVMLKNPILWIAVGGGALVAFTVLFLTRKRAEVVPPPTPAPPKTYGETVRVSLPVPSGWRRVTSAEVAELPELGAQANALMYSSGFTSLPYGTLAPFVASNGWTYATWVEQHYHEPGGSAKPWGLHHGVTILAWG